MPLMSSTVAERYRVICRMQLHSALRTAFACLIIGGATLYGPKILVNQIKFAAYSYLTALLIVSDASIGDTFKGCWHAFCATVQVVPLAMLVRWFIQPTSSNLPVGVAAVTVGVAAFLVALPECTHLTAKKIAFGQIVLVCADAVFSEDTSDEFIHPAYVAASTALGALASVLALAIPYPGLASDKVQRLCRIYAENASERMNIYLRAFTAPNHLTKTELLSQAKPLAETGAKLLQSITILWEGIQWEKPWRRFPKTNLVGGPEDRLQSMELGMRGIEYSLASSPPLQVEVVDQQQLSDFLQSLSIELEQKIKQVSCFPAFHSMTEPETKRELNEKPSLLPLQPMSVKQEWVFFFFSCIGMFLDGSVRGTSLAPSEAQTQPTKTEFSVIRTLKTWRPKLPSFTQLQFAFKCSLSLGLAMLFGLIFDKTNGCWAGLVIAISFVTGKQAVFTMANTRAQGTAFGSVYGVICCFLFHYEVMRLLALLPWIILTSFFRNSKMYGQAGGVSAAIGALLILGRVNYGDPHEFALARLTEVFIGLAAFISVELFLQKTRASTLAKNHLSSTLCCLQDCLKETAICPDQKNKTDSKYLELRDKQRNLEHMVCVLKNFIADAESEPDFWYMPFRTSCYQKLVESLSNIGDMLHFITCNFEGLSELSQISTVCKEFREQMNSELELFQETLTSLQIYLQKAHSTESPTDTLEKLRDLEAGQSQNPENLSALTTYYREAERTAEEEDQEDNKRVRERMIQYQEAIRFCIRSLIKEIEEIEIHKRELDQWEN